MDGASVAHEDRLLLHHVPTLAMCGTRVNGVLVVEAPADRVAFDDLIAHVGGEWQSACKKDRTRMCASMGQSAVMEMSTMQED